MLIQPFNKHEYNAVSNDDAEIWELVRQSEVHGIPPLALCPLCSFLEGNAIEEVQHGIIALVKRDVGKGKEQLSQREESTQRQKSLKKKAKLTFAADVPAATELNDGDAIPSNADHSEREDGPSTSFALSQHIAAHLQYLMVLSLRLMSTHG